MALACLFYYVWFFLQFGISGEQLTTGLQQIGRYLARMFVWHDFWNWPFGYYFTQIGVTTAIVFAGTLTATVLALLLSFFAARNIMRGVVLGTLALLMRRLFDVLRGIDMAIWGLIFVRAVGLGPLAGCWRSSCRTPVCWDGCTRKDTKPWTDLPRGLTAGREWPAKASLWHFYPVVPDLPRA